MPKNISFLDLKAPYEELREALDDACLRVMRSGWYVLGKECEAFEAEFAAYCEARCCVGVGNGLDGLTLTLRALGVGPGDEVIVASNTYIATWLAVSATGATPVPVEPDPATFNLDPARVEAAITPRTRALLPVHLYGQPAPLGPLGAVARRHGLKLVEDAAQAHGARWEGRRVGGSGAGGSSDAAVFSFYPTKNLGAHGDGGAVTTDDPDLAERIRVLRNYGSRQKYHNEVRGVNSRLDEMQAALLRVKLGHLDAWNARRRRLAARYHDGLAGLPGLALPTTLPEAEHVWHVYTVRHPRRDALAERLRDEAGVGTLIFYPVPPHLSGAYADHGWAREDFPIAASLADTVLSLPLHAQLSEADVDYVIDHVRRITRSLP